MFSLRQHSIVAFVPTLDPERARGFYRDLLDLKLVEDHLPFALVFDANGIMLRVTPVQTFTPHPFTVLGWEVANIQQAVAAITGKGVSIERFAGLTQDEVGIWRAPGGDQVAWFRDPDGNLLSLSQHLSRNSSPGSDESHPHSLSS